MGPAHEDQTAGRFIVPCSFAPTNIAAVQETRFQVSWWPCAPIPSALAHLDPPTSLIAAKDSTMVCLLSLNPFAFAIPSFVWMSPLQICISWNSIGFAASCSVPLGSGPSAGSQSHGTARSFTVPSLRCSRFGESDLSNGFLWHLSFKRLQRLLLFCSSLASFSSVSLTLKHKGSHTGLPVCVLKERENIFCALEQVPKVV